MASDKLRPVIAWDEAARAFHVKANDAAAEKARGQFSKRYVYYLGSHEGCGCGFPREYDDMLDLEELIQKRENQRRLVEYLALCLQDEVSVELYGCWSGDEEEASTGQQNLAIAELAAEGFFFFERRLIVVTSGERSAA